MKILLSAYACGPGQGSEPGVGWNAAVSLSRLAEVHVLTTSEFRHEIDEVLSKGTPGCDLHFHFFEIPFGRFVWRRKNGMLIRLHYAIWQRMAGREVRRLDGMESFTSAQHVSFVRYWSPSCLRNSGIPYILGPVGGAEYVPKALLGGFPFSGRCFERFRNCVRALMERTPAVKSTIRNAAFVLATTKLSAKRCAAIRGTEDGIRLCGESALSDSELAMLNVRARSHEGTVFCCLGRLIPLKRFDLAIRAFAAAGIPDSKLILVGGGREESKLKQLSSDLCVSDRVEITGFVPRRSAMEKLAECDAMIHPSTHDSGGWACVEAMASGIPVICLDWGGPGAQITDETGFRIPAGKEEDVVRGIASAMKTLSDRSVRNEMSRRCRERAEKAFRWSAKASFYFGLHRELPVRCRQ